MQASPYLDGLHGISERRQFAPRGDPIPTVLVRDDTPANSFRPVRITLPPSRRQALGATGADEIVPTVAF
jgi:hypothetical protein